MNKDIFQSIVESCEIHAARLRWSMEQLSSKQPFSPEQLSQLSDIDLAIFDQFIVRFSKLQDLMGAKLLPGIIELTYEEGELNTFIDKLHRLEKIGALESVEQWLKLREMRYQFAHDYPDEPEIQAALLRKAFVMAEQLLNCLAHATSFASRYQ